MLLLLLALTAQPCRAVSTVEDLVRLAGTEPCLELAAGGYDFAPMRTRRREVLSPHVSLFGPQRPGHGHFEGGLTFHDLSGLRLRGKGARINAAVLVFARAKDLELVDLVIDGVLIIRHAERVTLRGVSATRVLLDDVHFATLSSVVGEVSVEDSTEVKLEVPPRSIQWSRGVSVADGGVRGGRERERLPPAQFNDGGVEVFIAPFFIDRTEVTFAAYAECADAGACRKQEGPALQPVTPLTLAEAKAYCAFRHARLPTTAEWEQAARGLDDRPYPWGFTPVTCRRAAVSDAHDVFDGPCVVGPDLHEVCSHPEGDSPWGLCDLAGNAWEWTADGLLHGGDAESDPLINTRALRVTAGMRPGVRCARDGASVQPRRKDAR